MKTENNMMLLHTLKYSPKYDASSYKKYKIYISANKTFHDRCIQKTKLRHK